MKNNVSIGNTGEYFVAGELERRWFIFDYFLIKLFEVYPFSNLLKLEQKTFK